MTFTTALFAYVFGLPLGIWLYTGKKYGLRPMPLLNALLGWLVNMLRSIPFIILILLLIPFTSLLMGKSIGSTAAIVPLTVAAIPFVARLVENSLEELDTGLIEAAKAMGATNWQIIYKVLLPESVPSLIRGLSITIIALIGYVAMAGAVGGGGLGDIAIRYGFHRFQPKMMLATLIILIALVQLIQSIFNPLATAIDKRNID
jgi:D-methionine transport system permease protein